MKTRILAWLLLLCAHSAWAQLPVQETFETDGEGTRYKSGSFFFSTTQYFLRAALPGTPGGTAPNFGGTALSGTQGSYFWACEGVRGSSSTVVRNARYVCLNGIDVSGYTNVRIKVAFADPRSNTGVRAQDFMKVQYRYGDTTGAFTDAIVFTRSSASTTTSRWTRLDSAAILSPTFATHQSAVINSGTGPLYVRVLADYNFSSQEVAFDNIRVTGTASAVQKPTITSNVGTGTLTFAEGTTTAQTVFSDLTVGNPAKTPATLTGATVTMSGYAGTQDEVTYTIPSGSGITASSSSNAGTLTLTFSSTTPANSGVGVYEQLLESVQYKNGEANNATAGDRTFAFTVRDGAVVSNPLGRTITVTAALNGATFPPRTEDFDSNGEGTRYGSNTQTAPNQGFLRLEGVVNGSHSPGATYASSATFSNLQGTGYWYSNGSSAILAGGVGYVTLAPVNTTGFVNLRFKIKAGTNNTTNFGATDFLRFAYSLDGSTNWTVFTSYTASSGKLRLGGIATNPALSAVLTDLDIEVPAAAAGPNVYFRVETASSGGEEIVFDNIQITGTSVATVTTDAPSAVTGTSATLGGAITNNGGGTVTERGVVYSTTNATPTTADTKALIGTTTPFSGTVAGLTAATTYYVRAYAINAAGTGYGAVQTFTTQTSVTSIVRASTNPTNAATVNYTVTFANSVTGVTAANFGLSPTVTGASIGTVTGSGTTYTVPVNTGTGSGPLQLNLTNATGISPGISNTLPVAGEQYTIDRVRPTVAISSTAGASGGTTATTPIPFTVTFSESVTGFVSGDVTVSGGAITSGSFGGSGTTYTFTVTPTASGTVTTVNVPANVAQDAASNGNTAATQFSITYQQPVTAAPVVVTPANGSITNNATPTYTGTAPASSTVTVYVDGSALSGTATANASGNWSKTQPTALAQGSHTVYATAQSSGQAVSANSNTNTFTVDLTPPTAPVVTTPANNATVNDNTPTYTGTAEANSTVTVLVNSTPAGTTTATAAGTWSFTQSPALTDGTYSVQATATDAVGNTSPGSNINIFTIDTTPPAAPVVTAPANGAQINTGTPTYLGTAEANATVYVIVDGSTLGSTTANASGNWSFTQSPALGGGSHTVRATAADAAGNTSPNSNTNTFIVDTTPPVVSSVAVPANGLYKTGDQLNFTVNFNETVTVNTAGGTPSLGLTVGASSRTAAYVSGSPGTALLFRYTVASGDQDTNGITLGSLTLNGGTIRDQAGNNATLTLNGVPSTAGILVDGVAPTVVINSTASNPTNTSPILFTVTFSESVTGFVAGDVTVGNGTVTSGSFGGSGASYSFTVTPTAGGTVTVNVAAGVATDAAGNGNTAATQYSLTYVASTTVASVTRLQPAAIGTPTASFRVVFAAAVSGVSASNFALTTTGALSGASVGSVTTVSGTTYDVSVNTGSGDGTLRLDVQNSAGISPTVSNVPYTSGQVYTVTKTFISPVLTIQGTGGAGNDVTAFLDLVQVLQGGSAVPNAISNASFETHGPLSNGNYGYNPTGTYWSFNSMSGIAENGSAFTPTTPIPGGVAVAFVQSYNGTNGQLQQGLNVPTGSYQVSFQAAQRVCCASQDQQLQVFINGVFVGSIQPGTSSYTAFTSSTFNVRATSRVPGQALSLPTSTPPAYVDFAGNGALLGSSYTQEAWIKLTLSTSSTEYYVLGNGLRGDNTAAPFVSITGNGRLQAGFGTGTSGVFVRTSPNTLVDNQWNHVAATYNEATDQLLVYLNGEQVLSTTSTAGPTASRVRFVGAAATNDTFFPGLIDEISQWNRALTRTELRLGRHLIRIGNESGLVSYLQFNDSGATTADFASGATGTLAGSATRTGSTVPVGYGTSNLQTVTASTTYAFPTTNVSIAFAGVAGSSETVVSRLDGQPMGTQPTATGLQRTFVPAYWIVDKYDAGTFSTANVTYTLSPTDISLADQNTPSNLKLFKRGSNSDLAFDAPISATAANAAAGTVTFPVTSFSQTVIGTFGTSPLPVTLVDFTAERLGEDALLTWITAQEKNNAYFAVESSVDGREFRLVERVGGQGTSTTRHDYRATDRNLGRYGAERVYYRLRQVDYDGTETLSDLRVVAVPGTLKPQLMLYPNPARSAVKLTGAGAEAAVQVFDALGRLMLESRADASGAARLLLPESLPTGVYVVRAGAQTQRLVVE